MTATGQDTIRTLGALALASRLKRLSDRLARDISRIYAEHEVNFEARWFPVAFLLFERSPLAVTEIAEQLKFTHPAVNQIAGQMEKNGLLVSARDRQDDRKRLLSLSKHGRQTVTALQPMWEVIRNCNEELLALVDRDFLGTLDRVEDSLAEREMYDRVVERLYPELYAPVDVIDFEQRYQKLFKQLNVEWLQEYFRVEPADLKVLDHPDRHILANGGRVFLARAGSTVVGTAALVRHNDDVYEIAKMAVTRRFRSRGIGRRLAQHCIEQAATLGAREVVLATSPKLTAANLLYRKLGFRKLRTTPPWATRYARATVYMRLRLPSP